ncbi:MAG: tRNA (adenosine(37)-N6)-threonylcarbamoyltransferase complex ATPase subunit type 1 TsaE [Bacteroidales bacterium]|nr:tRNA (adenosine(37)-N6)-threonylcarbamoyltransferase complex ATPase subunit type 1 TsaE [Bacteroidales bacterium]
MNISLRCETELDLPMVAGKLIETFPEDRIFAFYGKMGVGKTTFIKVLCKELQVLDIVNSPTFAIINEYLTESDDSIYHFDFYRINKPTEAMDIGLDDYLYSGSYCLMEWPEKIEEILSEHYIRVDVTEDIFDSSRTFKCQKI